MYTKELADKICQDVGKGKHLCDILFPKGMPSRDTLKEWRKKYPEFAIAYEDAVETQAENIIKECDAIISDTSHDILENGCGGQTGNNAAVNRAKERINWAKWRLERINPKKYMAENLKIVQESESTRPIQVIIQGIKE